MEASTFFLIFAGIVAAVCVIFSNDIADVLKKIFSYPWAALLLPLFLLTLILTYLEPYLFKILHVLEWGLDRLLLYLASTIHFKHAWLIAAVPVLVLLTILPIFIIKKLKQRKTIIPFYSQGFVSIMIWLFLAILLLVKPLNG